MIKLRDFKSFVDLKSLKHQQNSGYIALTVLSLYLVICVPVSAASGNFKLYASLSSPVSLLSSFSAYSKHISDSSFAALSSQVNILVSKAMNTSNSLGNYANLCPELKLLPSNQPTSVTNNNTNSTPDILQRNTTIDTEHECGYTVGSSKLSTPGFGKQMLEDRRH